MSHTKRETNASLRRDQNLKRREHAVFTALYTRPNSVATTTLLTNLISFSGRRPRRRHRCYIVVLTGHANVIVPFSIFRAHTAAAATSDERCCRRRR